MLVRAQLLGQLPVIAFGDQMLGDDSSAGAVGVEQHLAAIGFLAEVVEELRDLLCDETGNWRADYVRLRFSAAKPGTAMLISP
jgi:hypothetical protein